MHSGVLPVTEHQHCSDDVAVKSGVDVFSDFVALVCSKDSPSKLHLRHQQQQQPVSSLLSRSADITNELLICAPWLHCAPE